MIRFFPILLIIQVFCIYHAYKNRADQYWFWLIIFIPLIGSILYLYHHFYSRENIAIVSESVKGAMNSNYHIEKLENQLEFSNSITNRTNLADAYADIGRNEEAIQLYESCISEFGTKDLDLFKKLVLVYYSNSQYDKSIEFGSKIENEKIFKHANERIAYAWALKEMGDLEGAERNFKGMDSRYSNYPNRLQYAYFLEQTNRKPEAIELLEELLKEFDQMNSTELRPWKSDRREILSAYNDLKV